MSIEFNERWAEGLDGEKHIAQYVGQASEAILQTPHALRTGGAASGIDYALAAVCDNADTEQEAYHHLCFIVAELENVRDNMRASIAGIPDKEDEDYDPEDEHDPYFNRYRVD